MNIDQVLKEIGDISQYLNACGCSDLEGKIKRNLWPSAQDNARGIAKAVGGKCASIESKLNEMVQRGELSFDSDTMTYYLPSC